MCVCVCVCVCVVKIVCVGGDVAVSTSVEGLPLAIEVPCPFRCSNSVGRNNHLTASQQNDTHRQQPPADGGKGVSAGDPDLRGRGVQGPAPDPDAHL